MEEIHEGVCAMNMMLGQIQSSECFWTPIKRLHYLRVKCHKCQVFVDKINTPPISLHNMTASWAFAVWRMDVIGTINLKKGDGHRFVLVTIAYFIKCIEPAVYAHVTQKIIQKIIAYSSICFSFRFIPYFVSYNFFI
jgi:hypothetical protein